MTASNHIQGIALGTLAGVFWGAMATCVQYIFSERAVDPLTLCSMRLLVGGAIMVAAGFALRGPEMARALRNRRDALEIAVCGLAIFLAHLMFFYAIYYANAGVATIFLAIVPLCAAVWGCVAHREPLSVRDALCFALAMGGVVLIVTGGDFTRLRFSFLGVVFSTLSMLLAVVCSIQPRSVLARVGVYPVTSWGLLFGGLVGSVVHPVWLGDHNWSVSTIAAFLFVVVVGTDLAFACYFAGLKRITPVMAGLLNCMEPLSTYAFSIVFLGVVLSGWEAVGVAAVIANVVILSLWKKS